VPTSYPPNTELPPNVAQSEVNPKLPADEKVPSQAYQPVEPAP
jgi:hypothetical protein